MLFVEDRGEHTHFEVKGTAIDLCLELSRLIAHLIEMFEKSGMPSDMAMHMITTSFETARWASSLYLSNDGETDDEDEPLKTPSLDKIMGHNAEELANIFGGAES